MDSARALSENLAALLRRCWVELGHSSLFYFLHRELRLSKGSAQYRKVAAELIREIPGAVEPLRDGRLCLTSVVEAARVVTADNWEEVLPRFYGLSRREAMEVVAGLQPHPAPPARTIVTAVRPGSIVQAAAPAHPKLEPAAAAAPTALEPDEEAAPAPVQRPTPRVGSTDELPSSAAPPRPVEVVPLTAEQSRLHATVSSRFLRKLEAAADALSHARPGATPGEILEAGLDLLLAQAAKRRGQVEKPRKMARLAKADHIPAQVKREVWARDGGRCHWALESGGSCGSTRHLELDHIRPRSLGGASTTANLRLLCRPHNDLAARRALGDQTMDRFTWGLRGTPRRSGRQEPNEPEPAASVP